MRITAKSNIRIIKNLEKEVKRTDELLNIREEQIKGFKITVQKLEDEAQRLKRDACLMKVIEIRNERDWLLAEKKELLKRILNHLKEIKDYYDSDDYEGKVHWANILNKRIMNEFKREKK